MARQSIDSFTSSVNQHDQASTSHLPAKVLELVNPSLTPLSLSRTSTDFLFDVDALLEPPATAPAVTSERTT
jgi:hypothetical protein